MSNNSDLRLNGINPLSYLGVNPRTPVPFFSRAFDPTSADYSNFILGTIWLNTSTEDIWMLVSKADQIAVWVMLCICGTTSGITIIGDTGGPLSGTSFSFTGGSTGLTFNGAVSVFTLMFAGILANNGVINLGTDATDNTINIGTDANLGRTINIGNNIGNTSIIKEVGADFTLDGNGSSNYTLFPSITTGSMIIGGSAQSGIITLGNSTTTNTVSIGTGTGVTTINIGTGSPINAINIGSSPGSINLNNSGVTAKMTGVAGIAVANKNYVTINTATGQLGSDTGPLADALVLIQTISPVTNVLSVEFTTGITPTYNNYLLVVSSITGLPTFTIGVNTNLLLQLSVDGGATYITTNYATGEGFQVFLQSFASPGDQFVGSSIINLINLTSGSGYISSTGATSAYNIGNPAPSDTFPFGFYNIPSSLVVNAFKIVPFQGSPTWSAQSISLYGYII